MRILIFYSGALGLGHKRSAEALRKAFNLLYPMDKVYILNALKDTTSNIDYVIKILRANLFKIIPDVLRIFYQHEEKILKLIQPLEKVIYYYYSKKFEILIKKVKPDMIICTHAFPSTCISRLNNKIPLVYVITDFDILSYHTRTNADFVIVPNEELKHKIEFTGTKIYATGIPIDPEFTRKKNKTHLLQKYNLVDKPTVLILGGSTTLGYYKKILPHIDKKFQVIVCVGNNKDAHKNLINEYPNVKIIGFTERIDEIYRVSDVVITKPGGLTSSELLAMKLPIIITNPLPGIEEKNASYLVSQHVAFEPKSPTEIEYFINELLTNKKKINEIKSAYRTIGNPNSALDTVKLAKKICKGN